MALLHNLGFPRIGARRELKFALESFWHGKTTASDLLSVGERLRSKHWQLQQHLDWSPVGEFSFYDQVLDMSFTLGNLPERFQGFDGDNLDNYFRVARGRSAETGDGQACCAGVAAGEMTKWFDTNYHYIVPEFSTQTRFNLDASRLLKQVAEANAQGVKAKPVLIGPVTYLWLGKAKDGSSKLELLDKLLPLYEQLLEALAKQGAEWVQIDEPVLVTDLDQAWLDALRKSYEVLGNGSVKVLLATYFGCLQDNLDTFCQLNVQGLHLDAVNAQHEVTKVLANLGSERVLSLGVVNGRNIWKTNLLEVLEWLEPIAGQLADRLWLAPSCSLLHVPVDLEQEETLDSEVRNWLAFAVQKLEELRVLKTALNEGRVSVHDALEKNRRALESRRQSSRVINPGVRSKVSGITSQYGQRNKPYAQRAELQREKLQLPDYPTTTIGSFPQTQDIRSTRLKFKRNEISPEDYQAAMRAEIERCVREQEALGLDVLVHGEAERNDMVEYFGEQLDGYVFSQFGWVQSYGSRCVKPPILFGDIRRPKAMTVAWTKYAQSLTDKPMKGMLTGPVTILNWSFVRDDQPRSATCFQLALAIREEVLDLEQAGVSVIQIDEAALREGLPLRQSQWNAYLSWAVEAFRITANGVKDDTQIHTHMCYSEFNDIIAAIADMDADVITIETSRSDMELLDAFDQFNYPNEIGPGVYDIHSPNTPTQDHIVKLMQLAAQRVPVKRLWVNPDCGLKTRRWEEVLPALQNMIAAARSLRSQAA